jgi:aspartyl-tRNA(Asn)/glutamyl-tRNA(Gln) amidotransferase subunit C
VFVFCGVCLLWVFVFSLYIAVVAESTMHLTQEEVRHVAELAKLRLTEAEIAQFAEQLSAILGYAERLQEVDTSHVPPTPYVLPLANVLAADEPTPGLSNTAALANAPDAANGFFRVAAVFEE